MNLSQTLVKEFAKSITPEKEKASETQVRGTVVINSEGKFVRLDGSNGDVLTPISEGIGESDGDSFVDGDRVLVLIKDHQAIVNKNLTVTSRLANKTNARFYHDSDGAHVLGDTYRTDVKDGMQIVDVSNDEDVVVASFSNDVIELAKNNSSGRILFCDGYGEIYGERTTDWEGRTVTKGVQMTTNGNARIYLTESETYDLPHIAEISLGQMFNMMDGDNDNPYGGLLIESNKYQDEPRSTRINLVANHIMANYSEVITRSILEDIFTPKAVTLTSTNGTFTKKGLSATLIGNVMRLYFNAAANAAISAGNITNQTMMTITITDPRIRDVYSVSATGGTSGPNAQMHFASAFDASGNPKLTVTLAAIAQNIAKNGEINAYVAIPVVLNFDAYFND